MYAVSVYVYACVCVSVRVRLCGSDDDVADAPRLRQSVGSRVVSLPPLVETFTRVRLATRSSAVLVVVGVWCVRVCVCVWRFTCDY